ncbi:hypothetical protein GJV04_16405 [Enterobacteriaceae bacterium RIT714]|nr:hypothetical protein [Enterobacteriaceae bacterium RIT714]
MRRSWLFRSLHVHRASVTPEPVNVSGRLNRRRPDHPGSRQENRRYAVLSSYFFRLIGDGRV